jgi:hypothetical protein
MGLKGKQGRYLLNMRMILTARVRESPARDSTFMCLKLRGGGHGFVSLKK